jgi:hypothetical protein
VALLREQPALREQIPQRASYGFEAFALAGILQRHDVVANQVPVAGIIWSAATRRRFGSFSLSGHGLFR